MENEYSQEWSERMHSALQAAEVPVKELEKLYAVAGAMYSVADDINSVTALRTVVKALSNEMIYELKNLEYIKRSIEYGLQLPEAEQEHTGE